MSCFTQNPIYKQTSIPKKLFEGAWYLTQNLSTQPQNYITLKSEQSYRKQGAKKPIAFSHLLADTPA